MSIVLAPGEIITTTHPSVEEQQQIDYEIVERAIQQEKKEPPSDCTACYTKQTRKCEDCTHGRVHNEKHSGKVVEMCFSCGTDWV